MADRPYFQISPKVYGTPKGKIKSQQAQLEQIIQEELEVVIKNEKIK